jgi:hypothetical protein
MKRAASHFRSAVVCLALIACAGVAQAATVAYPSADAASFLLDYPSSWTLEPGGEEGDYMELIGPTGAVLSLRTIEGTEEDLMAAIEDTTAYLAETYSDVELQPVKDNQGPIKGFYTTGTGNDEEGGVVFQVGWYACNDGSIAEIWLVTSADDSAGVADAGKILGSFRLP